ncbi:hypothetical protein ACHAXS_009903 [Conticribra weissflogii]
MRGDRLLSAVSMCSLATALTVSPSPPLLAISQVGTSFLHNGANLRHSLSSSSPFLPHQSPTPWALCTSTQQDQDQKTGKNQPKNSLLKIMINAAMGVDKKADGIKGVQDFDEDLAVEIETALKLAGATNSFNGEAIDDRQELKTVFESLSNINDNQNDEVIEASKAPPFRREIIKPKIKVSAPPHTSLAQVVANQYGIDIASVPYSGSKITAADVEYYRFKLTQPPSTPEALNLAYKLGIDLNVVSMYVVPEYGKSKNSNEPYELKVNDIEQYLDNLRSIRMIERRSANSSGPSKSIKQKKLDALDERMEKNIGRLTQSAKKAVDKVTGGIVEQIVSSRGNVRKTEGSSSPTESDTESTSYEKENMTNGKNPTEQTQNDGQTLETAIRQKSDNDSPLFFLDRKL